MRFPTPDITPVDKVMQVVHIRVVARVPFALPGVGWRRWSGQGLPARASVRGENKHRQLGAQQAFRFRTFIWWHTIHEQSRPRPVRPFPRTTFRVLFLHREDVMHYIAGDVGEQRWTVCASHSDISRVITRIRVCAWYVWRERQRRQTGCFACFACRAVEPTWAPTGDARRQNNAAGAGIAIRLTNTKHWYGY